MSQSHHGNAGKGTNDDSSRFQYPGGHPHPHPYLGNYYHHYYPPPPYHPSPYIGPPTSNKQTPSSGSSQSQRGFYSQQYDVDAFTPHPPKSSRSHRAAPPTITPHDWIPEGLSSPKMSPYFETPEPPTLSGSGSSESTGSDRPVPARSAFMCFMQARRKENTNEAAEAWRLVSKEERAHWENVASKDRKRYNKERKEFEPSARKVRRKKDPSAPKRPMSAFLMYAQTKRAVLQRENPDIPNADISRMLGEIWRKASVDEKRPFLEREEDERKVYRAKMERFKSDQKLAKSLAPTLNNPMASAVFDQRQDEGETLARAGESADRYAPPPNINEFGAAYPVEAAYLYSPFHGDRQPVLTPVQRSRSSKYWEGSAANPIGSGIKFSYPRPDVKEE